MEVSDPIPPSLLYRNLVARNAREPRRIYIAPPPLHDEAMRSPDLESLVALRIVPNYSEPFTPVLFCDGSGDQVVVCSFNGAGSPLSAAQMDVLERYNLTKAALIPLQLDGSPSACRTLLLIKHVLERLSAPTSQRELMHLLKQQTQSMDASQLRSLCQTRYDVLDQAWLWAIKWARLSSSTPQRNQLKLARELHQRVKRRYDEKQEGRTEEKVQTATETTLRNILHDYRYCLTGQ
jgi:hypothetical protein